MPSLVGYLQILVRGRPGIGKVFLTSEYKIINEEEELIYRRPQSIFLPP